MGLASSVGEYAFATLIAPAHENSTSVLDRCGVQVMTGLVQMLSSQDPCDPIRLEDITAHEGQGKPVQIHLGWFARGA